MAWIEVADVTAVYPTPEPSEALIYHVQALAEIEIGEQDEPVSNGIKAVMVQIVHRFALAGLTDDNIQQETIGGYSYTRSAVAGLGFTNAEKRALRKAAGIGDLSTVDFTRGDLETNGPTTRVYDPLTDWR
jgi:hypothetical protein